MVSRLDCFYAGAYFFYNPGTFMAQYNRIRSQAQITSHCICMADAGSNDFNQDFICLWFSQFNFFNLEVFSLAMGDSCFNLHKKFIS
ncbi:Uncharacterised protein [Mycobacteroides abscessus subsp. abscessus]|nr:Uncharacterised protein [Mycobacteroides abscessus subsp. abscessus]